MNLTEYATYYVSLSDGSDGYLDQIHCGLRDFERVTGICNVADLTVAAINDYLRQTKHRLAPRTRWNRRGYLRMLLWHASTNPALTDKPAPPNEPLAHVKVPQTIVQAWTPQQVQTLLLTVDRLRGEYRGGLNKRGYWRSYVLAAWDLGLRGCDMRSVERNWIQPHGAITIVQRKTGRIVQGRLRQPALEAIAEFQHPGRLIWPQWCRLDAWRKCARRIVHRAGLPGSIGWLRASAATATEIAQPGTGHLFLGHSNRQTFESHYFDRSQQLDGPQPPLLLPAG